MIDETKKRMGIEGTGYGKRVDLQLSELQADVEMSREDFLRLAWACVDQASCMRTVRLAQRAQEAIEDLYDAEPQTLRDGQVPEQANLSDAERGMLLEMPMTLLEVKDGDANLLRPLVFKGLITCEAGTWVLTEAGRVEVRKWGP
jgi:hypothetical protein